MNSPGAKRRSIGLPWLQLSLAVAATLCASSSVKSLADNDADVMISGRISDHAKQPVAGAQVRLVDESGDLIKSTSCYSDGSFSFVHKPCGSCSLEVVPDEHTGLATALIDNVSGDKNRNFVVELHRGFAVAGRIASEGKGLKGLTVKVTAVSSQNEHVHGGGYAKTARDGRFHMILTPGAKQLVVLNQKYPDMAANQTVQFTVTADMDLPDIVLAPR